MKAHAKFIVQFSAPTDSGFANGVNTWARKVVETLPSGGTNTIYTNYAGQLLLKDYKPFFSSLHWITYCQYDDFGRLTSEATPSAVSTYTMVSPPANLGVVLNTTSGLIKLTNYAATTTASTSQDGDVAGYVKSRQVKKGSTGTAITTEEYKYREHTTTALVTTRTFVLAQKTVYENEGSGARTTEYSYTWHIPPGTTTESNQVESMTIKYPSVATSNNGSGLQTSTVQFYDKWRRPTWFKDEDGFIRMKAWNRLTGACTQSIVDVNTASIAGEPAGWVTPAGGGLHLTTSYVDDFLGRWTRITDPASHVTYKVYKDAAWEVRTYPKWTGTATTGPTEVTRSDKPGWYDETLTMSATPNAPSGFPDGTEAISNVISVERGYYGQGNPSPAILIVNRDSYFNPPAWTPSTTYGALGTNFYRKILNSFDGLPSEETDWTGTFRFIDYDVERKLLMRTRITTTPTFNPVVQDMGYEYDGNGVGNHTLTKSRQFTSASVSLDTLYTYDFRDRQIQVQRPDGVITVSTLDNLGRVTQDQTYAGSVSAANLRAQTQTAYDEKGQACRTTVFQVDPLTGSVGNTLTTNLWYNARGQLIKQRGPNGEFVKTQYDGAGRATKRFTSFDDGEANTDYNAALTVASDTVIDETVTSYDAVSNVIQTTRYQRTSTTTVLGDLATSWTAAKSRRTFTASWFDLAHRITDFADYGNNNGSNFTRPPTAPATPGSDTGYTYLITKYAYDVGGRRDSVTDNKGFVRKTIFDGLSRATAVIENFSGGGDPVETDLASNRRLDLVYDTSGRLSKRIAKNPKGLFQGVESQTTEYVYGTDANQSSPPVLRNDVLVAEIYPDSDDVYTPGNPAGSKLSNGLDGTYDRIEYTYDYASRKSTLKDQRQTVHTYSYDTSGRFTADTVTALGTADGAVLRLGYGYDSVSRMNLETSYSDTGGTTVLNQVKTTFDGWGNKIKREDSHVGAVGGGTPSVQMAYADGVVSPPGPGKYVRPVSTTYPSGRVVYFNYPAAGSTSVGDHLSRIDNIANDAVGTSKFAQYTYLGTNVFGRIDHPLVLNGLRREVATGGNPVEWDRWGQPLDERWKRSGATFNYDRYQYTYDRVSNRMTRDVTPNSPPSGRDEYYVYDNLHRLTKINRGNLSGGQITDANANFTQNWDTLESQGNWRSWIEDTNGGGAGGSTTQARTHNKANEVLTATGNSPAWVAPAHDLAGNLTTVPQPGAESTANTLTYDAWNRLVKVQAGATTLTEFQYDAGGWRIVKFKPNGANWDRTDYYYNMGWQCVEERKNLNVVGKTTVATIGLAQYVWDLRYIDAAVLRFRNADGSGDGSMEETLYYTQDANMNTTALVEPVGGTVVERYVYDPYGKVQVLTGSWTAQSSTIYRNEILYAGYRQDPETALYHVRHRHYHPSLGRWVQRDPIGYHDGVNLYEYIQSRPIRSRDPSGLKVLDPKIAKGVDIPNKDSRGLFALGLTQATLKVGTWCRACGPWSGTTFELGDPTNGEPVCYKPLLSSFIITTNILISNKMYKPWPGEFGKVGRAAHRGVIRVDMDEETLDETLKHEMEHIEAIKIWDKQNEPKVKAELDAVGCKYTSFFTCLLDAAAIGHKWEDTFNKWMAEEQKKEYPNNNRR